jgi:3-oxoacyl-[acyl-carrier-protein] synthase II
MTGVMLGSGIGGLRTIEDNSIMVHENGPRRLSPFFIPASLINLLSGHISIKYGFSGPNQSVVTACSTGAHAIGDAARIIQSGDADVMIAGGAESSVCRIGMSGFASARALSTNFNDCPEKASRPWDKDRDGFVMGEGAGVVVIEELEHAKKRGATIYAELAGYGATADAYHLTSPHPEGLGAAKCMEMALRHAKLNTTDVQYINAHATSTPVGDLCELRAIKRVFGDYAKSGNGLLVSGTKSMTGHLLGAAGGIELVACIQAIQDQIVPPTINVENLDPEVDVDVVPNTARPAKVNAALSNSFGFGGHNAALLIKKFEG